MTLNELTNGELISILIFGAIGLTVAIHDIYLKYSRKA